ncbi:MAG: Zn-dependent hydrolase, partial [Aggregatilineales bacterium]
INSARLLGWMDDQAKIGATPDGGLSRPALSAVDIEVRDWFRDELQQHGFEYRIDGAGNQTAFLKSENPDAKTLLIGSHFDSVPDGGRFDGALGVLAAFEAAVTIKENNISLPFHLEVINFTDEEGTLTGLFGSSVLAGLMTADDLQHPRGGRETLIEGLTRAGLSEHGVMDAERDPDTLLGYIEVHIEQGTRLEKSSTDIGVVTSIVGIRSRWLTFTGEAAHAGTEPITERRDAFMGAAEFSQQAFALVQEKYSPGVVNFGMVEVQPGAFNIVPGMAKLALEFRHGDAAIFDAMEDDLLALAAEIASDFSLGLEIEKAHDVIPAPMSEKFVQVIEQAADNCNLSHTRLMSFAGHDAQSLAQITDSVMYFVPSVNGISHNPREYTAPEDCVNAANVMLQAVLRLDH